MSRTADRTVTEPERFVFDQRVDTLNVRIVNGTVNVVGTEGGPVRLEVTELDGPPLKVRLEGSTLTVTYEDLQWKGLLKWWDRKGWQRHAVISLAVPQGTSVEVGVVDAGAVISGISGSTSVQGVNGDTTLVGLTGPVKANTVAGSVEAQSLSGDLKFNTVSGDLTVVEGSGSEVSAYSVSGNMVLDLDPSAGAQVRLTTVSGEIAIRIPEPGDAEVEADTTSGHVSCDFEELRVSGWGPGQWASKRIGAGRARLRATTVSGAIALLRRPPFEDAPDHGDPGYSSDPTDPTASTDPTDSTGSTGSTDSSDGDPNTLRKDI
jgi:hypothetical protein